LDELSRINDWSMVAREVARRGDVSPAQSDPRALPSQLTAAVATELERSPAAVVSIRVELMGQAADRVSEQRRAQQQASERAAGEQRTALARRPQPNPTSRAAQAPRIVIVDQPGEAETSNDALPQLRAYAGPDARDGASSQPTAAEQFASFGGERAVAAYAQQRSWLQAPQQRQLLDLRA
jgi:hypothetical protein